VNLNPGDPNPAAAEQPNYLEPRTPDSFNANANLRQDLDIVGWKGGFAVLKVTNVFGTRSWGVLNMDMQGWGSNTYWKPTRLPGFDRLIMVQVGFTF
jgi:hypothetical protein